MKRILIILAFITCLCTTVISQITKKGTVKEPNLLVADYTSTTTLYNYNSSNGTFNLYDFETLKPIKNINVPSGKYIVGVELTPKLLIISCCS